MKTSSGSTPLTLYTIKPELQAHIFSYLNPFEETEAYSTSHTVSNFFYQNQLIFLRHHPTLAKFLPKEKDLVNRVDCRKIKNSLFAVAQSASGLHNYRSQNCYPYGPQLLKLAKNAKREVPETYLEFHSLRQQVGETSLNKKAYTAIRTFADKSDYEDFLLSAAANHHTALRQSRVPNEFLTTSAKNLLSVMQLLNVTTGNCDEERFQQTFFPLLKQTIVYNGDFIHPEWREDSRCSMLNTLAAIAGQKDLPSTFTRLLKLLNTNKANDLLVDLSIYGVKSQYLSEVLHSRAEINREFIERNGYYSGRDGGRDGVHMALMQAANRNKRDVIKAIFEILPGTQIDIRILQHIRDLFKPELMTVEALERTKLIWEDAGRRRRNYPNIETQNEIIAFFNEEIARRYPHVIAEEVITTVLQHNLVRQYPERAEQIANQEAVSLTGQYPEDVADEILRIVQRDLPARIAQNVIVAPPVAVVEEEPWRFVINPVQPVVDQELPQQVLQEDAMAAQNPIGLVLNLAEQPAENGVVEAAPLVDPRLDPFFALDNPALGECAIL